jgi:hypothetical protein
LKDIEFVGIAGSLPARVSSQRSADKRASHNAVERARREMLNQRFRDLQSFIPNLAESKRASKLAIVRGCIAHFQDLGRRDAARMRAAQVLITSLDDMRSQLNELRKEKGLGPVTPSRDEVQARQDLLTIPINRHEPITPPTYQSGLTKALSMQSIELEMDEDFDDMPDTPATQLLNIDDLLDPSLLSASAPTHSHLSNSLIDDSFLASMVPNTLMSPSVPRQPSNLSISTGMHYNAPTPMNTPVGMVPPMTLNPQMLLLEQQEELSRRAYSYDESFIMNQFAQHRIN